jgi:uncharacterized integral membrane protein
MNTRRIVVIVLVALVFVFVVQNLQVVELQVFFWKVSMSRALMLLGTLLIGLISGLLLRRSRAKKS